MPITEEGALELARCARGTPRIANRLLKRVRDFATVQGDGTIDEETAIAARRWMDIDEVWTSWTAVCCAPSSRCTAAVP